MNRTLRLSILAALTACSTGAKTAEIRTAERAAQTPLQVRWSQARDQSGHLTLTAVVEVRSKLHQKVTVHVEVPQGLALVSGAPSFELPAEAEPGDLSFSYEFTYAGPAPSGDLKLVADLLGSGMGVHASDAYRFGKPEAVPPRPQTEGPNLHYGNKDLGPAVPLDK